MKKRLSLVLIVVLMLSASLVQAAPQRIVSLTPSVTENLFALGVGDRVVGVTSWCTYPAEAQTRTIVGSSSNLDLEVLLDLEPDLVIGDTGLVSAHLQALADLGIPLLAVNPTTLKETQETLIVLGKAVGAEVQGWALATEMENRLAELTQGVKQEDRPLVFVEIWNEPLMSAGPGSFMDELINLAGGINVAGDTGSPWPVISEEIVIDRDPDLIILTCYNLEEALGRSAWQDITAYKQDAIFEIDPDIYSRTTPRLLDALEEMISMVDSVRQ